MGQHTDIVANIATPHLKPEHQKWLRANYHDSGTEGLAQAATTAAAAHPEVVAANKVEDDAGKAFAADRSNATLRSTYQSASEESMNVFAKKVAEHFGSNVDTYLGQAGERDRQAKEASKAKEIASVDGKFKSLSNGTYARLCEKCGGRGVIEQFKHNGGECYSCNGSGMSSDKKQYTKDDIAGIKQSIADRHDNVGPTQPSAPAPTSSEKPKGFTNKYAGNCVGCGTRVGTGEGVTSRGAGGWEVRCVGCHHG
jgi:hypothetical protein